MTAILRIVPVIGAIVLLSCNTHSTDSNKTAHSPDALNVSHKTLATIDTPRSFVKNYGANDNNPLFVFVGEKIWVEPLPHESGSMDNGFKARYAILKKVYGQFSADTIEFVAYDHYGTPPFSKFKNVLLYVSADSGMYYHQKYMYNDVYRTKDGHWAGTYAWDDYEHAYNKNTKIKPVKIDFSETVYYATKMVNDEGQTLTRTLPKPYFRTVGDSAVAVYGNYVDELFMLKRDGYLTAREIFKHGKLNH